MSVAPFRLPLVLIEIAATCLVLIQVPAVLLIEVRLVCAGTVLLIEVGLVPTRALLSEISLACISILGLI